MGRRRGLVAQHGTGLGIEQEKVSESSPHINAASVAHRIHPLRIARKRPGTPSLQFLHKNEKNP
jgi:hypothetical protein